MKLYSHLIFLSVFFLSAITLYSQNIKEFDNENLKIQIEENFNAFSPFFYDNEISILFYLRPGSPELELIGSVCPVKKTNSFLQKKISKLSGSSYSVTLLGRIQSITELKGLLKKELDYNSILSIHYSGKEFLVKKYLTK